MKNLFLIIIIFTALCVSCTSKQASIDQLSDLYERLSGDTSEYTNEEWDYLCAQYEQIEIELKKYDKDYTDEELIEIGKLKGKCLAQITKHTINDAATQIKNASKEAIGIVEGLLEETKQQE